VEQHVAIGMGDEPEFVRDAHAAQGDEITLAEAVYVVTVADTHDGNALLKSGRDSNRKAPAVAEAQVCPPAGIDPKMTIILI
jgi:hypothetical protein